MSDVHRDKCRYCARGLAVIPLSPAEAKPHCEQKGCRWCDECYRGETSVSPVKPGVREA